MENRTSGWISGGVIGTLVVSLLLGRPLAPPAGPAQGAGPGAAPAPATPGPRPATAGDTTRFATGERLVREFLGDTAPPEATLARRRAHQRHRYSLDVLIATVPDPVDSRLDWAWDSYVASIRRAYERAGFVIDRFWMPWGSVADTVRLPDGVRVRESYPGALLFRHQSGDTVDLALVYLVGEVPTRGVHRAAMIRALRERRRLLRGFAAADTARVVRRPGSGRVKIVGPAFSGSSLSLREVLDGWDGADSAVVRIVTGSATNCENRAILHDDSARAPRDPATGAIGVPRRLPDTARAVRDSAAWVPRIEFSATVHSDEAFLGALERRVFGPMQIPWDKVVILRESSTGYGQNAFAADADGEAAGTAAVRDSAAETRRLGERWCGAAPPEAVRARRGEYMVVPFPMNISRLRTEYARRPVSQAAGGAAAGAPPAVPVDLSDPARPLESPPVLSALTAPALEQAVREIAGGLIRRRAQAVIILASDVRDKMFLAGELRRRVRDVEVFTFESNALFLAPDHNHDLRGMVVVSTYPLFLRNQWWTARPDDPERLVFANEGAQGIYNAVLVQLGREAALSEYVAPAGPPAAEAGLANAGAVPPVRPPVWITAVGAGAFAPVAMDTLARDWLYLRAARVAAPGRVNDSRVSFFVSLSALLLLLIIAELARRSGLQLWRAAFGEAPPPPDPPGVAQEVRCASLRVHGHLYRALARVAVTTAWLPVGSFYRQSYAVSGPVPSIVTIGYGVALAVGLFSILAEGVTALGLLVRYRGAGLQYALGSHWQTPGRRLVWLVEIAARTLVMAMGFWVLYQAIRYLDDIQDVDGPALRLYLHRVARVDAGVTPLVPLLLGAAGLGLWCAWHLRRVHGLASVPMFEAACLGCGDARVNAALRPWWSRVATLRDVSRIPTLLAVWREWRWRRRRAAAPACPPPAKVPGPAAPLRDPRLLTAEAVAHVNEVRGRIFLMVPNLAGLLLLTALVLGCGLLLLRIRHTLEHVTGTPYFDRLLRYTIVGSLVATAWAVYRLIAIWRALRRVLGDIATTPLLTAFDRLPREASRLTRLTLVGAPACEIVSTVRAAQWHQLRSLAALERTAGEPDEEDAWAEIGGLSPQIERGRAQCHAYAAEGECFVQVDRLLHRLWNTEPDARQIEAVRTAVEGISLYRDDEPRPDLGIMFRRSAPGPLRLWLRAAEEFAAVQVVDYLEWVLQHMRTLTWFLFLSLLLATALFSSYPYEPQRTTKLVLALVLLGTVGTLVYVMTDMNRDEVLSRIGRTDPGRITWNAGYVLNIAVVSIVPLVTLLSSELPELRSFLFSWLDPFLRALAR